MDFCVEQVKGTTEFDQLYEDSGMGPWGVDDVGRTAGEVVVMAADAFVTEEVGEIRPISEDQCCSAPLT